ncbi:hypothetical protein J2848_006358 [Azospirillum lipoferum]|uniref:Flagellar hook-length control protein FliK n=1 Tax=Azospirillum lipoferum TaxID=193 RepID=A0A5A9GEW9_AZOLI|nr:MULTISPECIES: flagellar hook-length control protein FliK [Azospirillum]KAA0591859.1 flagellar hook-length control protein FliK [Azospirillum lipoferum]MCP1614651.1 hypothetical protein [Azospirillum lipoferum]MDW5537513.1 flagellar hook-length control protein FliK [Azospirillum sp. NL1]
MTSMPDAVSAPPRPAPAQRGASSGDDSHDEDFASLVDEAAEEEPDDTARPDRLRKRRDPRPDDPAAMQSAITRAVVQSGSGNEAPLMPWMVAAAAALPQAMPTSAPGEAPEAAAASVAPPGSSAPKAGQSAAIGQHPAGQAADASAAAPAPTAETPAPDGPTKQNGPAQPAPADATAQGSTGQTADAPALLQTAQAALPATAAATPVATVEAPPSPDGRESRRDESSDPRTAVRATRGAGRQGAAAEKADQPSAAATTPKQGQPAPEAASAPAGRSPAPPFTAPSSAGGAGGGETAATGFEAVPTLPAQAATHYAAAAASGRAATAHSPAMAQLAAPLVRVAESGGGEFHIDLAPAELGRIRVVADVSDGKVALTVQAEQADTLALLRRDLTQLERALGDAGLSLDGSSLQFSLQGDGQSRGFAAPDRGGSSGGWRVQAEAVPEPIADRPLRPIDGLVDVTV